LLFIAEADLSETAKAQGLGAPELPGLVEVILLASEIGSNSCKALADCSLHLSRTLVAE
jgi:hypothetical protein